MIEIQGVDPKMIAGDVESAYPTHPGSILNNCPQKFRVQLLGAVYSGGFRLLHDVKPSVHKSYCASGKNNSTFVCRLASAGVWSAMPPRLARTIRPADIPRRSSSEAI